MKPFTPSSIPILKILALAVVCGIATARAELYRSGTGAWDTTTPNWGTAPGGPYNTTWTSGSNATFEGSAGTVTLGGAVSLANLTFNLAGSYAINGNSLNFAPGSIIRTSDNRYNQTITSVITGSPAVRTKDFGAGNQYLGLVFAPASGTQTLGAVLNPDNTGNTDKAGVTFAGSTSGNTVASISYAGGDRYADTNFQSGGWTVPGNMTTGTVRLSGGTHIFNGTVNCEYSGFIFTGGTLGGTGTINENVTVPAAGSLSPGAPTGTLSFIGTLDLSPMAGGSGKLNYDLGTPAASDKIAVNGAANIGNGALGFNDFVFTNLGGMQAGTYVLMTTTAGITGTLDPASRTGTIGGFTGVLQINGNNIEWATDADLDGMPDTFELAHTSPSSPTALSPNDDLEHGGAGDGLTNLQEYQYGTDPDNPDSDGDTLEDGPEVAGAGSRPPTDPTRQDTDGDTLGDLVETNTGTWTSSANTGTNPAEKDSDNDALTDTVETNTDVLVGKNNTGTDPNLPDSDSDGAGDWYEVTASYTNPNSAGSKPNVPYPLPDPDGAPGNADKPLKVYIMSGQSNMVGIGYINGLGEPGSLSTIAKLENKFPNLVDGSNNWTIRNDVRYRGVVTATGNALLTPGQGADNSKLGPELGFGHVMGWYHDEQVVLLKASQGNRSLSWDFLPPGSVQFQPDPADGYIYAGHGDAPDRWLTSGGPSPFVWYAGLEFDECFRRESDFTGPNFTWATSTAYTAGVYLRHNGVTYVCKADHTSGPASEPGAGTSSSTYWNTFTSDNAADVLDSYVTAGTNFEIAGFVWWQGHKDGGEAGTGLAGVAAKRYETNLVTLINSLRAYYAGRYPGKIAANAPFVVATVGFGGGGWDAGSSADTIWKAQMAVGDPAKHSEFAGNVASVDTTGYWRDVSESPGVQGFHYNNNAETYMLVGDALGRAMVGLQSNVGPDTTPPAISGSNPADNATGVSIGANLILTFNEAVTTGTGNVTLKNLTNSTQSTIAITDTSQVSVTGAVLTINPTANLAAGASYAIRIDASAIDDTAGNSFAGIADDTTWNFTTALADTSPPTSSTFSPSDNATGVATGVNLVLTFNEAITAGTGNITIKNLTSGTPSTIAITDSGQVSISGAVLTINPAADLADGRDYAINIASGAVTDLAGNPFAGINDDTTWNFTVGITNPVADPGGPYFVTTIGGSLSLDGSGSLPSGSQTITLYEWDLDNDGDFDEGITGATPSPLPYALLESTYGMIEGPNTVRLRVTDNSLPVSKTATAEGTVTIVPGLPPGDRWWDGPNTTGATDGTSQGGSGTWSTAITNWDPGSSFPNPIAWNNANNDNAIFGGSGGTCTLADAINLKDLTFQNVNTVCTIAGQTLRFTPGATIRNNDNRVDQTITSAITGSPAVNIKDYNPTPSNNTYLGIKFAPASGTQALGAVLNPDNTGNKDKSGVTFAGSTTGNTVASISYAGGDKYADTSFQSGEWSVLGNITTGTVKITGGTHTLSGTVRCDYNEMRMTGGTVKGAFTILTNDRRYVPYVDNGATISPGTGIGTITLDWGTSGTPVAGEIDYSFILKNGSTYEWEVGAANATDTIHLVEGRLYLKNFTLKITDAGGNPSPGDQLPVFTYASGVPRDLSAFPNAPANFVLPEGWSGAPSLVDDGNGTIHLTGIDGGGSQTPYETWANGGGTFGEDDNGDGVTNGIAWTLGATGPDVNALDLLPALDNSIDPAYVIFSFDRNDAAQADARTSIHVEYGNDLDGWTTAVDDNDNVEIEVTDGSPTDSVVVKLKRATLGAAGRIFVRLKVAVSP